MILNIENLDFAYGVDDIFKEANLQVKKGEHIGIVGPNGSGKSTLLKLITDRLLPDQGSINISPVVKIGYLEQKVNFESEKTIKELFYELFSDFNEVDKRLRELEKLLAETEDLDKQAKYLEEYDKLQEYLRNENFYSFESQIKGMIKGLGFTEEDLEREFSNLSGGEKTRISLGLTLLREPDLLILDEPTNYLDIRSLDWLETLLKNYKKTILVVSHDRYFLDNVCNRIVEVENYKLNSYNGNYSEYTKKKEKERIEKDKHYAKAVKELNRQKSIIRRYRDINSKQSSKHARSREIALSKMELPDKDTNSRDIHFLFEPKVRSGDDVLTVENISKSFTDDPIFKNINFKVHRGDKIVILGKNGIGKSTLFNILNKVTTPDTGKVYYGSQVYPSWFDQESNSLDQFSDFNLIETIRESDSSLSDGEIRNFLANFLFTEDDVFKKINDLSGGEKVRIKLAKIMLSKSNFLLLDEPTNHIDMSTRSILEDVLDSYDGTLLIISHDRYFINEIANKIFEFTPEGINEYLGNYDDYKKKREEEKATSKTVEENSSITKTQLQKNRKKEKEQEKYKKQVQKNIKELERKIETIQINISDLETIMSQPDFYSDQDKSLQVLNNYNSLKLSLEDLNEEWMNLSLELEELEENKA